MKRVLTAVLVAVLALTVAGCSALASKTSRSGSPAATGVSGPYAAISASGPHEKAAAAALPAALRYVARVAKDADKKPMDVSAGKPTLVSYVLQARVADRVTLFEVRADGVVHELYRYPQAADPSKLLWQKAAVGEGASSIAPIGAGETTAADAVRAVVGKAQVDGDIKVSMYGYIFYWIGKGGEPLSSAAGGPFNVMVDTNGSAGSWSM